MALLRRISYYFILVIIDLHCYLPSTQAALTKEELCAHIAAGTLCTDTSGQNVFPNPDDCSKYYRCRQGFPLTRKCTLTHFDYIQLKCIFRTEARCMTPCNASTTVVTSTVFETTPAFVTTRDVDLTTHSALSTTDNDTFLPSVETTKPSDQTKQDVVTPDIDDGRSTTSHDDLTLSTIDGKSFTTIMDTTLQNTQTTEEYVSSSDKELTSLNTQSDLMLSTQEDTSYMTTISEKKQSFMTSLSDEEASLATMLATKADTTFSMVTQDEKMSSVRSTLEDASQSVTTMLAQQTSTLSTIATGTSSVISTPSIPSVPSGVTSALSTPDEAVSSPGSTTGEETSSTTSVPGGTTSFVIPTLDQKSTSNKETPVTTAQGSKASTYSADTGTPSVMSTSDEHTVISTSAEETSFITSVPGGTTSLTSIPDEAVSSIASTSNEETPSTVGPTLFIKSTTEKETSSTSSVPGRTTPSIMTTVAEGTSTAPMPDPEVTYVTTAYEETTVTLIQAGETSLPTSIPDAGTSSKISKYSPSISSIAETSYVSPEVDKETSVTLTTDNYISLVSTTSIMTPEIGGTEPTLLSMLQTTPKRQVSTSASALSTEPQATDIIDGGESTSGTDCVYDTSTDSMQERSSTQQNTLPSASELDLGPGSADATTDAPFISEDDEPCKLPVPCTPGKRVGTKDDCTTYFECSTAGSEWREYECAWIPFTNFNSQLENCDKPQQAACQTGCPYSAAAERTSTSSVTTSGQMLYSSIKEDALILSTKVSTVTTIVPKETIVTIQKESILEGETSTIDGITATLIDHTSSDAVNVTVIFNITETDGTVKDEATDTTENSFVSLVSTHFDSNTTLVPTKVPTTIESFSTKSVKHLTSETNITELPSSVEAPECRLNVPCESGRRVGGKDDCSIYFECNEDGSEWIKHECVWLPLVNFDTETNECKSVGLAICEVRCPDAVQSTSTIDTKFIPMTTVAANIANATKESEQMTVYSTINKEVSSVPTEVSIVTTTIPNEAAVTTQKKDVTSETKTLATDTVSTTVRAQMSSDVVNTKDIYRTTESTDAVKDTETDTTMTSFQSVSTTPVDSNTTAAYSDLSTVEPDITTPRKELTSETMTELPSSVEELECTLNRPCESGSRVGDKDDCSIYFECNEDGSEWMKHECVWLPFVNFDTETNECEVAELAICEVGCPVPITTATNVDTSTVESGDSDAVFTEMSTMFSTFEKTTETKTLSEVQNDNTATTSFSNYTTEYANVTSEITEQSTEIIAVSTLALQDTTSSDKSSPANTIVDSDFVHVSTKMHDMYSNTNSDLYTSPIITHNDMTMYTNILGSTETTAQLPTTEPPLTVDDGPCSLLIPCSPGRKVGNKDDCSKYFECNSAGTAWTEGECAWLPFTYFNSQIGACNKASDAVCQMGCPDFSEPTTTTTTTTYPTTTTLDEMASSSTAEDILTLPVSTVTKETTVTIQGDATTSKIKETSTVEDIATTSSPQDNTVDINMTSIYTSTPVSSQTVNDVTDFVTSQGPGDVTTYLEPNTTEAPSVSTTELMTTEVNTSASEATAGSNHTTTTTGYSVTVTATVDDIMNATLYQNTTEVFSTTVIKQTTSQIPLDSSSSTTPEVTTAGETDKETTLLETTAGLSSTSSSPTGETVSSSVSSSTAGTSVSTACVRVEPCPVGDVLPDPTDCKKYFLCIQRNQGDTMWQRRPCTANGMFDEIALKCINNANVNCHSGCEQGTPVVPSSGSTTSSPQLNQTTESPTSMAESTASESASLISTTATDSESSMSTTSESSSSVSISLPSTTSSITESVEVASQTTEESTEQTTSALEQTTSDAEQTTSDSEQTTSDVEETTSDSEQTTLDLAQTTSDLERTTSDSGQTTSDLGQTTSDLGQTTDLGHTVSDSEQTASDSGQTVSDSGQTTSALGQTASDSEQTASDSEQTTSDSGQTTSVSSFSASGGTTVDETTESGTSGSVTFDLFSTVIPGSSTGSGLETSEDLLNFTDSTVAVSTISPGISTTQITSNIITETSSTFSGDYSTSGLFEETTEFGNATTDSSSTTKSPGSILDHTVIIVGSEDALEGQNFQIQCSFVLDPPDAPFTLLWYLNNQRLRNSARIQITEPTQQARLVSSMKFMPIYYRDTGEVTCKVVLTSGPESEELMPVDVLPKPTITIDQQTITSSAGQPISIQCESHVTSSSHPEADVSPVIHWYKNGKVVDGSGPEEIADISDNIQKLQTPAVKDVEYSCSASNKAGESGLQTCSVTILQDGGVYCDAEMYLDVYWTMTVSGGVNIQSCPDQMIGEAKRHCKIGDSSATWGEPNLNHCVDEALVEIFEEVERIEEGIGGTQENMENVTARLESLTNVTGPLAPGNINVTAESLDVLAHVRVEDESIEISEEELNSVVNTISNLLNSVNEMAWDELQQEDPMLSVSLMWTVDSYLEVATLYLPDNMTITVPSENVVLQADKFAKSNIRDVTYPKHSEGNIDWMDLDTDTVSISRETLKIIGDSIPGESIALSSSYYKNINRLLPSRNQEDTDTYINSKVLAMSVRGWKSGSKLDPPIQLEFVQNQNIQENETGSCSYWDFGEEMWSTEGCVVIHSDSSHTSCQCNHLTNFAVLVSKSPVTGQHAYILSLISIIGCVISVGGMVLTILVYVSIWKHVKSHHAVVLINLCVALIIANLLFVAGVNKTSIRAVCISIAVLLHYFYLAAFFMMLVEGIQLMLYIIYVFHVRRKRETAGLIVAGWVLPAVIVGVCLAINKTEGYGTEDYCWLDSDSWLFWVFIVPAGIIIIINVVICVCVLRRISTSKIHQIDKSRHQKVKSAFWNIIVVMPILGITWVFGIFSVNNDILVFQYIFAVSNSLQGLFIFIFHALCNKKVRERLCSRLGTSPTQTSSSLLMHFVPGKKGRYHVKSSVKTQRSRLKSDSSGKSSNKSSKSFKSLKDAFFGSSKSNGKKKTSLSNTAPESPQYDEIPADFLTFDENGFPSHKPSLEQQPHQQQHDNGILVLENDYTLHDERHRNGRGGYANPSFLTFTGDHDPDMIDLSISENTNSDSTPMKKMTFIERLNSVNEMRTEEYMDVKLATDNVRFKVSPRPSPKNSPFLPRSTPFLARNITGVPVKSQTSFNC